MSLVEKFVPTTDAVFYAYLRSAAPEKSDGKTANAPSTVCDDIKSDVTDDFKDPAYVL